MLLRSPNFWRHKSLLSHLLLPLTGITSFAAWLRKIRATPYKSAIPVICVGNMTMGGAGKTPVAISLARLLQEQGKHVHFLSRGYGRTLSGLMRVDPDSHSTADVGDEPLLLSRTAPTWVCADRVMAVKAAIAAGADIVIMDDGLQNPSLIQDTSLLVIDGTYGLGNQRLFPAGPLREHLHSALPHISAVVVLGEDKAAVSELIPAGIPVIHGTITPQISDRLRHETLVAFAGIAHPEKFFSMLEKHGLPLTEMLAFPDHYPYTAQDYRNLTEKAALHHARLVTTEKDAVRFPIELRHHLTIIPIDITWDNPQELSSCLQGI